MHQCSLFSVMLRKLGHESRIIRFLCGRNCFNWFYSRHKMKFHKVFISAEIGWNEHGNTWLILEWKHVDSKHARIKANVDSYKSK